MMRTVAVLVALSTTACFYGPRNKPAKYVASAAMIAVGAALVIGNANRECDEESIGANIGCGIGKGMGKGLGYMFIGTGTLALGATLASPDPVPELPPR
jgi:hypothetical protein